MRCDDEPVLTKRSTFHYPASKLDEKRPRKIQPGRVGTYEHTLST